MPPEATQTQISPFPKPHRRFKIWFWVILIVLGVLTGVFFWVRGVLQENQRADAALGVQEAVRSELERCDSILAAGQGQFDEYEYCKSFVNAFSGYR